MLKINKVLEMRCFLSVLMGLFVCVFALGEAEAVLSSDLADINAGASIVSTSTIHSVMVSPNGAIGGESGYVFAPYSLIFADFMSPANLTIALAQSVNISQIDFWTSIAGSRFPVGVKVYVSVSGAGNPLTWELIVDAGGVTTDLTVYTFEPIEAKYIYFELTNNWPYGTEVVEIDVFGELLPTLEERVAAIEAILAAGVGLSEGQVNGLIDTKLAPVFQDIGNLGNDIDTIISDYNDHVHDKGSGSRNTTTPIPQISVQ